MPLRAADSVAPEPVLDKWPEFNRFSDRQIVDDSFRRMEEAGVNPDEQIRLGNEAYRDRCRYKNGARPYSPGFGPGCKWLPGRYRRLANGTWVKIG